MELASLIAWKQVSWDIMVPFTKVKEMASVRDNQIIYFQLGINYQANDDPIIEYYVNGRLSH